MSLELRDTKGHRCRRNRQGAHLGQHSVGVLGASPGCEEIKARKEAGGEGGCGAVEFDEECGLGEVRSGPEEICQGRVDSGLPCASSAMQTVAPQCSLSVVYSPHRPCSDILEPYPENEVRIFNKSSCHRQGRTGNKAQQTRGLGRQEEKQEAQPTCSARFCPAGKRCKELDARL